MKKICDNIVGSGLSGELLAIEGSEPVSAAVKLMSEHDFSQISITHDKRLVGSLNETHLYEELVRDPSVKSRPVESIMQPAFPFVDISTPVDLISGMITRENPALLVRDFKSDRPSRRRATSTRASSRCTASNSWRRTASATGKPHPAITTTPIPGPATSATPPARTLPKRSSISAVLRATSPGATSR